ncbi:rab11 family-interacting protein 1 isoform X2 [Phacochoerus africanus]|nr:rab11 family-interacting protein 1 isoform X2 [Phacochoerus africanus]
MSLAASAGRGRGPVWSPTHVQVTVLQARGLRAKGPGGTSDAYAVIQVGKEKYATSVSERSLGAPVWREEATFELPPLLSAEAVPAAATTLQLTVLHRALLGLDKFLGRAEVDLRELHRDQGRRKTQWYTLKSKPGKKDKERGEIEVDIQFMRNNMTASMFDLSMKDKTRNPFGKLKDKIKGKNKDSVSDTASAIIPSVTPSADSDDESPSKDKKKKSKIKTLFSKSNLQRTPLSQSMSVLPTSKADKVLLRPGDFQSRWEDEDEDESSSASDVSSHKRTASGDPKQLNPINFTLPKKDGLSFLGGLRSKNDVLSRSNVCINGNHVYVEQPEAKSETKDSSPSSSPSPQGLRKKHLFSSTENLATQPWKEPGEGVAALSESSTKASLKSMSLPSYRPVVSGDLRENTSLATLEAAKETKENKKQENKKSSLLSLVTGKKDMAKGSEGESPPAAPGKEREGLASGVKAREDQPEPVDNLVKESEKEPTVISGRGRSWNPFEDVHILEPEADPEPKAAPAPPVASPRAPQTRAVKPRPEVSPEAQPTPRPSSFPDPPLSSSAVSSSSGQTLDPSKLEHDSETQSSESLSVSSTFSSPLVAPISTSTPIDSWPSAATSQASSEEPPSLLKPALQKESLTQVPNTVSWAVGSLSKQPPIPVGEGTQDSPGRRTGTNDPAQLPLMKPEVGLEEELLRSPPREQEGSPPPLEEDREVPAALPRRRGGIESPAGKPLVREDADSVVQPRSPGGDMAGDVGMIPVVREVVSPLHMGVFVPLPDSAMQRQKEMGLDVPEAGKKIKKRVSFSKQLFTEEAVEEAPALVPRDRGDPYEPTQEGAAPGDAWHMGDSQEGEAVAEALLTSLVARSPLPSHHGGSSEGSQQATSSGRDIPLSRMEGDDSRMPGNQSKATDHEGLLSDPLRGFQSACGVKSPAVAQLDLTLPSIPEVASDDERVDQPEDDRGVARGGGTSSPSTSPAHPGWSAESLQDPRPEASGASALASSEQMAALADQKVHPGESPGVDEQPLGPGQGVEAKPVESGRPAQPPVAALSSPMSSPSFSEPFPATHSAPSSPHSDTPHTSTAESQKKATTEGSVGKVENSGKRKPLLQAWVSPSETQPVSAQPSVGTGPAKNR